MIPYGAKSRWLAVLYGGEENGVSSVRGRIPFTARVGGEGVQSVFRGKRERENKKKGVCGIEGGACVR